MRNYRKEIESSPQICGSSLPPEMRSYTDIIRIEFFNHGLTAGEGFSLTYSTEERAICGGNLLLPSGSISTPVFPLLKDFYVHCKWSVFGDSLVNRTVVFKFDVLDVPGLRINRCYHGGVYVKPGRRSGVHYHLEYEIFCGNYTSPVVFTTPFRSTDIHLTGLFDKPFRGIHGTYYVNNCGGIIIADSNANITSPGYPDGYPPNMDCHWIILPGRGQVITLTTVDFHLENDCDRDYVSISTGLKFQRLGKFCGDHNPHPITATNEDLIVKFHSDESGSAPGFWLTTSKIQRGCGGIISMTDGTISSPNYPSHYGNNEKCIWIIEYLPGDNVKLEFLSRFDIEMSNVCDKDYLLIEDYDDNNETWVFKARKCGLTRPNPIDSKGWKIKITFRSDSEITGHGFNIQYSSGCGGNFTKSRGQIFSPYYPYIYENVICNYTIGKAGQYIGIQFDNYISSHNEEKDVICTTAYLEIYEEDVAESNKKAKYCDDNPPPSYTLLGPVTIIFKNDNSRPHGFKFIYEVLDPEEALSLFHLYPNANIK
ncbi:CUB domain-containing protein 2-like [Stegodyphus dumicola]|uniref:CUB domain-containing protein 2-like n=1 Tax=Stegodyphus dumicola TaxID=202533 RepID=UPI0015AD65B5|nr:CUB domain-containing protein 2-like [Stegodyphus dumicola]XP_035221707.1 CUB domain-containing protein 2-like [Stegodyphus dumicola]